MTALSEAIIRSGSCAARERCCGAPVDRGQQRHRVRRNGLRSHPEVDARSTAADVRPSARTSDSRSRSGGIAHRVDVEAMKRSSTKAPGLDLVLQIPVGRRHDPRRDRESARSPPTRVSFRSSSTRSSLACAGSGSSPISSRNSVPPPAFSKAPRRSRSAPVNAPRSWPNEFAVDQLLGSAALLTATSGRLLAWTASMQLARDHFLPVPLSPSIEHAAGNRRHPRDRVTQRAAWPRLSPMSSVSPSQPRAQRPQLLDHAAARDGVLDLLDDALDRLGLVDEPEGAEPHGLHAAVVAAGAGVDDDGRVDAALLQPPQHFEAVEPRHLEVEDHAVDRLAGQHGRAPSRRRATTIV